MLSSEDWMTRKSAAELLLKMGVVLDEDSKVEVKSFVVHSLDSRRFDKVKVTREIMNRALEAWKNVPGGPEQDTTLSRSNSSISKVGTEVQAYNSSSITFWISFTLDVERTSKHIQTLQTIIADFPEEKKPRKERDLRKGLPLTRMNYQQY